MKGSPHVDSSRPVAGTSLINGDGYGLGGKAVRMTEAALAARERLCLPMTRRPEGRDGRKNGNGPHPIIMPRTEADCRTVLDGFPPLYREEENSVQLRQTFPSKIRPTPSCVFPRVFGGISPSKSPSNSVQTVIRNPSNRPSKSVQPAALR